MYSRCDKVHDDVIKMFFFRTLLERELSPKMRKKKWQPDKPKEELFSAKGNKISLVYFVGLQ